jgi:hypothetical protein
LIDNDFLDEGRKVISDLHGGDPDDLKAVTEYNEIKEMVAKDVSVPALLGLAGSHPYLAFSGRPLLSRNVEAL